MDEHNKESYQEVRKMFAAFAMMGLLAGSTGRLPSGQSEFDEMSRRAVAQADSLIKHLK